MHWIDASILIVNMIALMAIGAHLLRKNTEEEDRSSGGPGWANNLGVIISAILLFINDGLLPASNLQAVPIPVRNEH